MPILYGPINHSSYPPCWCRLPALPPTPSYDQLCKHASQNKHPWWLGSNRGRWHSLYYDSVIRLPRMRWLLHHDQRCARKNLRQAAGPVWILTRCDFCGLVALQWWCFLNLRMWDTYKERPNRCIRRNSGLQRTMSKGNNVSNEIWCQIIYIVHKSSRYSHNKPESKPIQTKVSIKTHLCGRSQTQREPNLFR